MFLSVISRFVCNRLNQSRSPSLLLLRSWDTKAEIKREMGTQRFVPPHKPLLVDRIKPSFVWCHILFMNFLIVSTVICQPNFPFLSIRISLKNNDTFRIASIASLPKVSLLENQWWASAFSFGFQPPRPSKISNFPIVVSWRQLTQQRKYTALFQLCVIQFTWCFIR